MSSNTKTPYETGRENGCLCREYAEPNETMPRDGDWLNAINDEYNDDETKQFVEGCKAGWNSK